MNLVKQSSKAQLLQVSISYNHHSKTMKTILKIEHQKKKDKNKNIINHSLFFLIIIFIFIHPVLQCRW